MAVYENPILFDPTSRAFSWRSMVFWALLILALGWFLMKLHGVLLPFVLGLLIAYLSDHLCDRMERFMPRAVAAGIVVVGVLGILIGAGIIVVPLLIEQLGQLLQALPSIVARSKDWALEWVSHLPIKQKDLPMTQVREQLGEAGNELAGAAKGLVESVLRSGGALLNTFFLLLITPVVAFYCMRDWDKMVATVDGLMPRAHAATIRVQARAINRTLAGFLRGQLNVCLMMGVFYAVGLTVTGLNFGLVIGLLSGLLLIIPYAGAAMSTIIGVSIAIAQFDDTGHVVAVAAVFLLGQGLESYVLSPKLVGDQVGLHPVWLIFGMLAGGALMGSVGVLIAVPLTAVIGVLARFAVQRYLSSPFYDPAMADRVPLVTDAESVMAAQSGIVMPPEAV